MTRGGAPQNFGPRAPMQRVSRAHCRAVSVEENSRSDASVIQGQGYLVMGASSEFRHTTPLQA
eukprot:2532780-Pleurochrysis_carterae.AAC.1